MNILLVGASGATGRLLTRELLDRGQSVRVIVRSPEGLPADVREHENLTVIQASVLDLSDAELAQHVQDCDAVASCLGHNMTFKGMFGQPRRLVTDAARRLCAAVKANAPQKPVKYVLMNTTGNWNRDLDEPMTFGERIVIGLLRLVLPPQADNEQAADFLRTGIFDPGQTSRINVGHFMADLITEDALWQQWKGQMPVIYNQAVE
jgi:NAD(P)-dependent dehydrogenase (short-subunit alcohol dehydrogenase family)